MRGRISLPFRWALLLALLALAGRFLAAIWQPEAQGLSLAVERPAGAGWTLVTGTRDSLPLRRDLAAIERDLRLPEFRATWTGTFLAWRHGRHQINIASDDGSRVWIDGTLVVDNGGRHPRLWRSGIVTLAPGSHDIRIEYEQWGGDAHLETWLRQPGGLSQRLDAIRRQFLPARPSRTALIARAGRDWLPWLSVGAGCAAYGLVLLGLGVVFFRFVERQAGLPRAGRALAATLTLTAIPIATGLLWGLPADTDGWAPDEISPTRLVAAVAHGFAAPWTSIYPPLHFHVLAPLAWLVDRVATPDGWDATRYPGQFVLHASMRAVSVLMAVGTLAWCYLLARLHGSARQGLAAVVAAASCSTLLYYGKTANVDVPYLYWVLAACTCVAAVARSWSPRLVVVSAIAGACAVGTKDQAAGFLLLAPAWLLWIRRSHLQRDGEGAGWSLVLRDPVWIRASVAVALTLAAIYHWPVDWTAPARHLDAARRGTYAPMVVNSLTGQLRLLGLEAELLVFMLGAPLAAASVGGLVWARRGMPGLGAALAIPIVSYIGLFLPVIRYTYDRFLLGVAILLACAAGPFCLWLWERQRWRPLLATAGLLGVLYTAGHAWSANALMARDSRYEVERALEERAAARRELVGQLSPRTYLPRADLLSVVDLEPTVDDVQEWSPEVLLFDRAWMARFRPADTDGFALRTGIETGRLGYRRLATWQSPVPWWAFQARPSYLGRYSRLGLTNLDKVNPRIELWGR